MKTLPDGSPQWLPLVEERLVGAALLSSLADVQTACAVATGDDFREALLGRIWGVLPFLNECPCVVHAAEAMDGDEDYERAGGLSFLVGLIGTGAYLYASRAGLEAHAALVRKEADRRRAVRQVIEEANEKVRAIGRGGNVIPINRAVGARTPFAS